VPLSPECRLEIEDAAEETPELRDEAVDIPF
jgi:hypothetical protein